MVWECHDWKDVVHDVSPSCAAYRDNGKERNSTPYKLWQTRARKVRVRGVS